MFPGQQGATCPAQLWPPRLGIKLLEGAPSTEKWGKGGYFRITKNRRYQPSFCTVGEKAPKWSYQPCHPCTHGLFARYSVYRYTRVSTCFVFYHLRFYGRLGDSINYAATILPTIRYLLSARADAAIYHYPYHYD